MKHIGYVFLAGSRSGGHAGHCWPARKTHPLGDYARCVRKDEKPASTKKYDNDNLPTSDNISVVGNATDTIVPEDANPAADAEAAKPEDGSRRSRSKDAGKQADGRDAQKRATNGNRRLPISRPRWTCSRVKWM